MFIEQLWNTELPGFDVDGPLPAFDPVVSDTLISKGRASVRQFAKDPVALAAEWRGPPGGRHPSPPGGGTAGTRPPAVLRAPPRGGGGRHPPLPRRAPHR